MASDNKVSSFILLILIGMAIYYLLNRECFNSLNNLYEGFVSTVSEEVAPEEVASEEVAPEQNVPSASALPPSSLVQQMGVQQTGVQEMSMQEQSVEPEIEYEVDQEPYVPQSVINDIATEQKPMTNEVFNFEANDEYDLNQTGSSLNDAFGLPIPAGAQTDTVDFKNQNMDNYNARDFLPREVNDEWFETDFSLAKYQLNDDKLINTEKYIIGINTVGQSLKNASWDIRGTIANPKLIVSPWNNSTYEPDFNLKPLC